jgi:hypothetical protein
MSFLPEEDQEFLLGNGIQYEELTEKMPDGSERRAVLFPAFSFSGDLRSLNGGSLEQVAACDLLVVIPDGYSTTKLDSFYTIPKLKRPDGGDPQNATVDSALFGRTWQFWSRHFGDKDWRVGIDCLRTYINYIRGELRKA